MTQKTFTMLLLGVALFVVQEARAANPRQHHLHGVVQSVDVAANLLTVQKSGKEEPFVFKWNASTHFWDGKEPVEPGSLKAGQGVSVSYRVRPGRLEASRVEVRRANNARENGSAKGGANDLMRH